MFVTNALSEQQVFTLYVIGTSLTTFLVALVLAGVLGIMHQQPRLEE